MLSTEGSGDIRQGVIEEIAPNRISPECASLSRNWTLTEEVDSQGDDDVTMFPDHVKIDVVVEEHAPADADPTDENDLIEEGRFRPNKNAGLPSCT